VQAQQLEDFFKGYISAFKAYDTERVVQCYQLPCTLNTPDELVLLTDQQSSQQTFNDIFLQLQQANTREINAVKASFSTLSSNLILACIDWVFIDDAGEVFTDFCAIYHLTNIDSVLNIINVVSHDLANSVTLAQPFTISKCGSNSNVKQ